MPWISRWLELLDVNFLSRLFLPACSIAPEKQSLGRITMRVIFSNFLTAASLVTLASVSSLASAKCSVDLRGTWQAYGILSPGYEYYSCTYSTDRNGNLESGSSCNTYYSETGIINVVNAPATGQFLTDDNCEVSGGLTVGQATISILSGKMNAGGSIILGIQRVTGYGDPQTIAFTMYRII
jgi:hypothetical protein